MRTRAIRAANRGRGWRRQMILRANLAFCPVESKRTSTADAATENAGSGFEWMVPDSMPESCHGAEDAGGRFTNVIDSLARTHSGLVSSGGTTFSTTGATASITGSTDSEGADSHPPGGCGDRFNGFLSANGEGARQKHCRLPLLLVPVSFLFRRTMWLNLDFASAPMRRCIR